MKVIERIRKIIKRKYLEYLVHEMGDSPELLPPLRHFRRACGLNPNRPARIPQTAAPVPGARALSPMTTGVLTLTSPLLLSAWLVINPAINPVIVSSLSVTSALFAVLLSIILFGRVRLADWMMTLMSVSMLISFGAILPAIMSASVVNSLMAASVIYGVCLALFVTSASSLYLFTAILRPRRWHEVGA